MKIKQSLTIIIGILIIGMIYIFFFSGYLLKTKQSGQLPADQTATSPGTGSAPGALPRDYKILFENVPGCGVVKNNAGEQYSYDFFCQEKVLGHVDMVGNWRVEHFLSYEGGNEFFGFFKAGAGEGKKYYWGPSILYKMNTTQGTFEKFLDASFLPVPGDTQSLSYLWGSKYFITDISKDGTKAVYCNYFDVNTIFVRDMVTGKIQEFKIDKNLYDFGDASFSDDGAQIAFAGMKRRMVNGKDLGFVEAELFVLDTVSGKITQKETSKNPGMYSINGWDGQNVSFDYLAEENVAAK